jgi:hypothetical protein
MKAFKHDNSGREGSNNGESMEEGEGSYRTDIICVAYH